MKIDVHSLADIERISSLMHDAVFTEGDMHFDDDKMIFRLDATRFMWERAKREGFLRVLRALDSRETESLHRPPRNLVPGGRSRFRGPWTSLTGLRGGGKILHLIMTAGVCIDA